MLISAKEARDLINKAGVEKELNFLSEKIREAAYKYQDTCLTVDNLSEPALSALELEGYSVTKIHSKYKICW